MPYTILEPSHIEYSLILMVRSVLGLDGTVDGIHYAKASDEQAYHNNNKAIFFYNEHSSTHAPSVNSMESEHNIAKIAQRSPTFSRVKPLRPRKQESQTHFTQQCQNSSVDEAQPFHPPRTSSLHNCPSIELGRHSNRETRSTTINLQTTVDAFNSRDSRSSGSSVTLPSAVSSTRSAVLDHQPGNAAFGVMGDFVPINSEETASTSQKLGFKARRKDSTDAYVLRSYVHCKSTNFMKVTQS
jgi:hypothetical protein